MSALSRSVSACARYLLVSTQTVAWHADHRAAFGESASSTFCCASAEGWTVSAWHWSKEVSCAGTMMLSFFLVTCPVLSLACFSVTIAPDVGHCLSALCSLCLAEVSELDLS